MDEIEAAETQLLAELARRRTEMELVSAFTAPAKNDPDQIVENGEAILKAIWPVPPEACGHGKWWRTPLGQLLAPVGHTDSDIVTIAVACEMLDRKAQTVHTAIRRGLLDASKVDGKTYLRVDQVLDRLLNDRRTTRHGPVLLKLSPGEK